MVIREIRVWASLFTATPGLPSIISIAENDVPLCHEGMMVLATVKPKALYQKEELVEGSGEIFAEA